MIEQSSNVFSEVKLLSRNLSFHVEYTYQKDILSYNVDGLGHRKEGNLVFKKWGNFVWQHW